MTELLNVKQAGAIIGIHESTVRDFCRDGRLKATKGKRNAWQIERLIAERFAAGYTKSHVPNKPNTAEFDKPVGRGWRTKHRNGKPAWGSMAELETAVCTGKVRALYLSPLNEPICEVGKGELIKW